MVRSMAVLVAAMMFSGAVLAHKVNVFAYVENQQLYVEGYFNDGKMAKKSAIEVIDPDGNVIMQDVTDDQGQITFDLPDQSIPLRIELNAGMGHQGVYVMSAEDLGAVAPPVAMEAISAPDEASPSVAVSPSINPAELEAAVQRAVGDAIKPLVRELSVAQKQASLSDIVGGIGLIVGVLGGFAFFKARQQMSKASGGD